MADMSRYSGASHFATNSAYEVQRTQHYEIVIEGLDDVSDEAAGYQEVFTLTAYRVGAPKMSVDTIDLKKGNETVKVAAVPKYDNISVEVYDVIGKDMQRILQDWFYKIFDPETKQMGLVNSYKKNATLYLYSPDSTSVRVWTLYGVFPVSISFSDMSSNSAEAVTVSLDLSVDRAVEAKIVG